jgi:soluble lytic murein transglycosylase-like protein
MTSQEISDLIVSTASSYGVDPRLALEVAMKESSLNPNVPDSSAGAIGIFQIEPATGADLGLSVDDLRDPAKNIHGGVMYLSQLLSRYNGNVAEALAANDWGMGNLDKAIAAHGLGWMSYAPIETQDYIQTILGNLSSEYSVSIGTPGLPMMSTAGISTQGWSLGTALWVGGALLAGWILFNLLE